ncbi:MAG: tRNA lysidine(34) synthetase TilS, partial [Agathobacter sp.]|nr:tRNA lysidine(34) synthetase TilS [Agathobacter sp.]
QAETVLFQMLRGSGLRGLGGMRRERTDKDGVTYLRPLLSVHRKEIEAYLDGLGQDYCTDSTNGEIDYHRNYIRKEIMPRLAEVNSQSVAHMARTAEQLAEVSDYLSQEALRLLWDQGALMDQKAEISIEKLQALHPAMKKQVLYEMLLWVAGSRKDLTGVHLEQLQGLMEMQSGKQVHLPESIVARREFDHIVIERDSEEKVSDWDEELFFQPGAPGKSQREVGIEVQGEKFYCKTFSFSGKMEEIPQKQYTKWMDYDKIKDGFSIRTRKSGDYLICDTAGHHKRLKNYFIEEKWPAKERDTALLLAQDSHVLWVVGGRISEAVKVTEDTKWILEITYTGGKEDESYPG